MSDCGEVSKVSKARSITLAFGGTRLELLYSLRLLQTVRRNRAAAIGQLIQVDRDLHV